MLKAQRLIKRLHQLLAAAECRFQLLHMQGPHSQAQSSALCFGIQPDVSTERGEDLEEQC